MRDVTTPPTGRAREEVSERAGTIEIVESYETHDETSEVVRVTCPDCGQPIALFADERRLPEHALCPTRWDPFGLRVCPGTGRSAREARPVGGEARAEDAAALPTLPEGLDWRMRPFSHAGGPAAGRSLHG